jgi:hypothetical protein
MMKNSDNRYTIRFQTVAAGLLIIFISVTTFANLFHNHRSLEQRPDCPACLWHQMSQEADDSPTAAELVASGLTSTDETPRLHDGLRLIASDVPAGTPIRAPPAL